jgi:hypothetical protein
LKPNEVAGPFELTIDNGFISFSEPMLSLDVSVCSDTDSTYSRNGGISRGYGMTRENGIYLIRIVARGDSANVYFDFEIEEADTLKQYSHPGKQD